MVQVDSQGYAYDGNHERISLKRSRGHLSVLKDASEADSGSDDLNCASALYKKKRPLEHLKRLEDMRNKDEAFDKEAEARKWIKNHCDAFL